MQSNNIFVSYHLESTLHLALFWSPPSPPSVSISSKCSVMFTSWLLKLYGSVIWVYPRFIWNSCLETVLMGVVTINQSNKVAGRKTKTMSWEMLKRFSAGLSLRSDSLYIICKMWPDSTVLMFCQRRLCAQDLTLCVILKTMAFYRTGIMSVGCKLPIVRLQIERNPWEHMRRRTKNRNTLWQFGI